MSIEISRETEDRLTAEARRLGVSVDELLKRLIDKWTASNRPVQPGRDVPSWQLGHGGP